MNARDAVTAFLDRYRVFDDPAVVINLVPEETLFELVERIDARPAEEVPLRGLVFGVKDNIDVAGVATTAGCIPYTYTPTESAFVVDRLIDAGAIPVAKTNLDQFATGLVGTRSPFGTPRNPRRDDHVPGGSSSGSAVAVARGLVDFALGTDTAGSGRVPAAFCGIVGLKPTPGLLSTTGSVPAVRSADCISIFTTGIGLAEQVFAEAISFDPADPFARPSQPPTGPTATAGVRLGILSEDALTGLGATPATVKGYQAFVEAASHNVDSVALFDIDPFLEAGRLLYDGPLVAERTAAVGRFIAGHDSGVIPVTGSIIDGGWKYSAVDAYQASYELAGLRREAADAMSSFDAIALPTTTRGATLAEVEADPIGVNSQLGLFTTFANLVDLCGLTIPYGGTDQGRPLSVTLYASAFEDGTLSALASSLDEAGTSTKTDDGATEDLLPLVVAGAHLRGQPLEHQLTDLGARFGSTTHTAPGYRLYALDGTVPAKPGLVADPSGATIEVDIWYVTAEALGRFLTMIPAPLALGTVELQDGSTATGFVCEPRAIEGARDITDLGGWRAYREAG